MVPTRNTQEFTHLHANGSNWAISETLGEFSARRKTSRGALFFTSYDVFDVVGWFPRENTQECMHLHMNGSNLAVSECLGEFCVLSHKTSRRAPFFTCYHVLDVFAWFPCKNTQESTHLHANGSNQAVSERLGEFSALLHKTCQGALFFTCYDVFDVVKWFARENTQECTHLHANGSNQAVSERLGEFSALRAKHVGERSFSLVMMCLM